MVLMVILCVSLWCLYTQPLCISQQNSLLFYYYFSLQEIKENQNADSSNLYWEQVCSALSATSTRCALNASSISLICLFPSSSHLRIWALRWRPLLLPAWKDCNFCCRLSAFIPGLPAITQDSVCPKMCVVAPAPGMDTSNPSQPSHWGMWVENQPTEKQVRVVKKPSCFVTVRYR